MCARKRSCYVRWGYDISKNSTPDDDDQSENPIKVPKNQNISDDDVDSQGPESITKDEDTVNQQNNGTSQAPPSDPDHSSSKVKD